jgi:hydroxymethylbilane synthase
LRLRERPRVTSFDRKLRVGMRGSALSRWQADWVLAGLRAHWPGLAAEVRVFTTSGDRQLDTPLPEIGGKGVFTEELEQALLAGEIDVAVHSLKDLPVAVTPGLGLGAICEREDARDVLISLAGNALAALPAGARVGTSSLRRSVQLLRARADLTIVSLRGNVDTRLRKARQGDYDAIVLAAAGVHRLGLKAAITEYLSFDVMLPAPGQGALAIQCRADDAVTRARLNALDHAPTRAAVEAERAFLSGLGGGCAAPVAAYATVNAEGGLALTGLAASADGRAALRLSGEGTDPLALGARLAQQALLQGAGAFLA